MFNIEKMLVDTSNIFNIPSVPRVVSFDFPDKWISFAELSKFSGVYAETGLHFYTADRDFECIWKNPDRYISIFKRFACVIMPDFSIYYDMPLALQIYNKYRSHWLACYFSYNGVVVIPNVNLNFERNDYVLLVGYPFRSVVAVSSVGSVRNPKELSIFNASVDRIHNFLDPVEVLHFASSRIVLPGATNIFIGGK